MLLYTFENPKGVYNLLSIIIYTLVAFKKTFEQNRYFHTLKLTYEHDDVKSNGFACMYMYFTCSFFYLLHTVHVDDEIFLHRQHFLFLFYLFDCSKSN